MTLHTSMLARLRSTATARATLAVTAALLTVVGLTRVTPLPEEATVVAWPALAAAFLLDTALYNEAGIAVGDIGFWILAVVGCYVEAVAVVAVVRETRRRIGSSRRVGPPP